MPYGVLILAYGVMRFCFPLSIHGQVPSEEDRQQIEQAVRAEPGGAAVPVEPRIWSEFSPAILRIRSVQLAGPDMAIVVAAWVRYGSTVVLREAPVVLVVRRDGDAWRITKRRRSACGG